MNLVGIDIGTQGVKAALYSAEGECRAEAFEPSRPLRPTERSSRSPVHPVHLRRITLGAALCGSLTLLAFGGFMAGVFAITASL